MTRRSRQSWGKRNTRHVRSIQHLSVEDLVGSAIVTAEGTRLGRVVDLLVAPGPPYRVQSLIYGSAAWLYRLHVLRPFAEKLGMHLLPREIAWDAVKDFNGFVVTLKRGDWSGRDFELRETSSAVDSDA
jgi:hypothetical protein